MASQQQHVAWACLPSPSCGVVAFSKHDAAMLGSLLAACVVLFLVVWLVCKRVLRDYALSSKTLLLTTHNATSVLLNIALVTVGVCVMVRRGSVEGAHARMLDTFLPALDALSFFVAYNLFTLVLYLSVKELRKLDSILHHVVLLPLAIAGYLPYSNFYVPFFTGVAETSTIFMCMSEFFRDCKPLQKRFARANTVCRVAFALSFFLVRTLAWTVMFAFWSVDLFAVWDELAVPAYIGVCWGCGCVLTGLQLYWSVLIAKKVRAILAPRPLADADGAAREDQEDEGDLEMMA